ncbi:MAG: tRNA nucleotidyltransferase (CCA-adding enzyme) [Candidatus Azotimanducaceae bacterium]|jgi:tRNA nucleotidyltransferase (CCA-adding enzyme)
METYLVGGAVRDELLGLPVLDRDWVVVGNTEQALLDLGYQRVGKDFPVFLHPTSKEEYALARKERKIGSGHRGFECDASITVTLEEDLLRRDLTINAIAKNLSGNYIDPHGGLTDIERRMLRHVSPAFLEDPLRILRLARFYARFADFSVAPETLKLAKQMINEDQLNELAAERIWIEIHKALETDHPDRFFRLLNELGAHAKLWPAISASSIDTMSKLAKKTTKPELRFAGLCYHATDSLASCLKNLKVPNRYTDVALASQKHLRALLSDPQDPEEIFALIEQLDAFRRPERFHDLHELALAMSSILGLSPPADWGYYLKIATGVTSDQVDPQLKGPNFGAALRQKRLTALREALSS